MLGNLDIAEHRLPQDGQFTVNWQETPSHFVLRPYHVRVVKGGIKVVTAGEPGTGCQHAGMQPLQLADFAHALQQPQGLVW